jgi:NitT/TauT family transport system substrate-binding protein
MDVAVAVARLRVVVLAALMVFSGRCVAQTGAGKDSPTAPAAKADVPKEVRIGYFANVTHAQAVFGVDSGDFAKAIAPSKLATKTFNAGPSLIESLFAGEIDIGYVGPSPALNAFVQSKGRGIRVVAGAAANGVVIVARPGSGIEKMSDLKGKRVATPQLGNTQDISARHYLIKELGQANADNIVPIANAEQVAMMARGQIDAAWAVEPWGARLIAEAGGKIIGEEKSLWPEKMFTLTLVVVTPEFLDKHADVVEKILGVHVAWTKKLTEKPAEQVPGLAAAMEKLTSKKMSEDIIGAAISRVKFTDEPLASSITTFAKWANELGLAKSVPDVGALVDTKCLERVKAASSKASEPAGAAAQGKP